MKDKTVCAFDVTKCEADTEMARGLGSASPSRDVSNTPGSFLISFRSYRFAREAPRSSVELWVCADRTTLGNPPGLISVSLLLFDL